LIDITKKPFKYPNAYFKAVQVRKYLTCGIYLMRVTPSLMYEKKSRYVNQVILCIKVGMSETRANNQANPVSALLMCEIR